MTYGINIKSSIIIENKLNWHIEAVINLHTFWECEIIENTFKFKESIAWDIGNNKCECRNKYID